jgi:hypothetical protein
MFRRSKFSNPLIINEKRKNVILGKFWYDFIDETFWDSIFKKKMWMKKRRSKGNVLNIFEISSQKFVSKYRD